MTTLHPPPPPPPAPPPPHFPPIQYGVSESIFQDIPLQQKAIDDVLGGEDQWKSVQATQADCEKCGHDRAYFIEIQIRSADEPATIFYRCCKCSHVRREG